MAQITLTFNVEGASQEHVLKALAANYGYQEQVPNPETGQSMQNPESMEVFVTNAVGRQLSDATFNGERQLRIRDLEGSIKRVNFSSPQQEAPAKQ